MGRSLTPFWAIDADAVKSASKLDNTKPSLQQPLAGVPILVKDNIATGAKLPTTAGSLALEGAHAKDDATVVKLLRDAGAVILGKANLTEFANILAIDMPAGYSSLGGQVRNPYAPGLVDDRDIPLVSPGGSSLVPRSRWLPDCVPPRSALRPRARYSSLRAKTGSLP